MLGRGGGSCTAAWEGGARRPSTDPRVNRHDDGDVEEASDDFSRRCVKTDDARLDPRLFGEPLFAGVRWNIEEREGLRDLAVAVVEVENLRLWVR